MTTPHRKRPKDRNWSRPLADLVGAAMDPVLARQGFSESDLILHWDDIVGERLAASSRPIRLQWPPRPRDRPTEVALQPATLVVRVEGAFALEMQHMTDQVLARINAHLGWRCVGRLAFKQGPIERTGPMARRSSKPSAESIEFASQLVAGVADDALRLALTRLGASIAETRRARAVVSNAR